MIKTYVVAGATRTGTTAAMKLIRDGGVSALYRAVRRGVETYPEQPFEYPGGRLPFALVLGKVVKRLRASLVIDMPPQIDNLHVIYMVRNYKTRVTAHPDENFGSQVSYWEENVQHLQSISHDPRVEKLVVLDFDRLVSAPRAVISMLVAKGWEIEYRNLAENAIDPTMRHA